MEKEWIPVIATLAGVVFGGGITSFVKWLELRHQRKQENKKLVLAKIEDLHQSISDYVAVFPDYSFGIILSKEDVNNKITPAKYKKLVEKLYSPLSKPNTLLKIYMPELKDKWDELSGTLQNLHLFGSQYSQNDEINNEIETYNQAVIDKCSELLMLIESKLNELLKIN